MNERRVVVTGAGVVSPFGTGKNVLWNNIREGNSSAALIKSFDASGLPTKFCSEVPLNENELDNLIEDKKSLKTMSRAAKLAMIAADEAFKDSGIGIGSLDPYKFGTSMGASGLGYWDTEFSNRFLELLLKYNTGINGNCNGPINIWQNTFQNLHPLTSLKAVPNIATAHLAIKYNARGCSQTITTACASSAQAIGEAYRQIKSGYADIMIAGGTDSTTNHVGFIALGMLGLMSQNNSEYKTAMRPFDKRRDGFVPGEGAAVFILEEYEHCKKRGAEIYSEVTGYASANDAHALTDEPSDARGSIKAMQLSLEDAGIDGSKVDYINAHGSGTKMNDKTETYAIKCVFGNNAYSIPVSSTKSMTGHLLSAAGAIEFAACIIAMKNQIIPPTINYEVPDEDCDLDYVPNYSRDAKLNIIQSNSFGFGGQNVSLIIKKI